MPTLSSGCVIFIRSIAIKHIQQELEHDLASDRNKIMDITLVYFAGMLHNLICMVLLLNIEL